ncbi:MAG: 2-oxo-4-hydroxy-4-carboxy-5-ureidoimidazoline decarboxylase [Chloroflexota bacterium]
MTANLELGNLNAANRAAFVSMVAPLFEGAPRFLDRLAAARPFDDVESMFAEARETAHAMPEIEQIELIDAHPRLGAPPSTVSRMSFREQGYDLDVAISAEAVRAAVAAELERLNAAYEARFGFRYCVHVAGRSRAALLPAMAAALDEDPDTERHRALDAVVDIARDRLTAMVGPTT